MGWSVSIRRAGGRAGGYTLEVDTGGGGSSSVQPVTPPPRPAASDLFSNQTMLLIGAGLLVFFVLK